MKSGIQRFSALILIPVALLFCKAQQAPPQQSTLQGLELLHKMQNALGGADKIAAIRDYQETISGVTWLPDGSPLGKVQKRTRWIKDANVIRLDQTGPRDTYVLYFDGKTGRGWEILPDMTNPDPMRTTGKAVDLQGGELKFAKNYLTGFHINMWLADRLPGYTVTSPKPNVVRIIHDDDANDFTLDPSGLPLKTNGVSLAKPDRPVQSEMRFETWTEVAGVKFPARRANYHNALKLGEITESTTEVNTGLKPDSLAAKPTDFAPEIARNK